jgi:hypothetical protein
MTKHYANPDETTFTGSLYTFRFGAYGDTEVCVYQRPDHVEDALEIAAEWLATNEPGHFYEPDYEQTKRELFFETGSEPSEEEVAEKAEADMTYTESGWLLSQEWTAGEEECDGPPDATFDRGDIADAYATYWASWHQGQGSHGYSRLCAAMALGGSAEGFEHLSENGQAIYRRLVLADNR